MGILRKPMVGPARDIACGLMVSLIPTAFALRGVNDGVVPDTKPHFHGSLPRDVGSDSFLLVVPRLRFMFCFVPKNACTQFNRMFNKLNGINKLGLNDCTENDPNFKSSAVTIAPEFYLNDFLRDPTWTTGVFLRDPLERLISAHRSKCEHLECDSNTACMDQNFSRGVLKKLAGFDNVHYRPQNLFCGDPHTGKSLGETISQYDYVGHLTNNHSDVARQVGRMLNMALARAPRQAQPLDADRSATLLFPELTARDVNSAVKEFFPADHIGDGGFPEHITHTSDADISNYFTDMVAQKALQFYSSDYSLLPGLVVPSWARQTV